MCRQLAIKDAFIGLAESVLVSIFDPLWNRLLDGFGNNPTGGPRAAQAISNWDIFYSGRRRGEGAGRTTLEELGTRVAKHLSDESGQIDERLSLIRDRIKKYGLG